MVKNEMVMTELERELSNIFGKIGLNFRQRRYYDQIFLSGYACKMIDGLHEYKDKDIEKIAHLIAEGETGDNLVKGLDYKIIYNSVKFALQYSNCQSQDEHDYENEIHDNSVGGFGICIPLSERTFFKNGFVIYYAFFPDFDAKEFKTKEKFDSMRPIKGKMDEIIEKGIYKESIVIKYDNAIEEIPDDDENYMTKIPERSTILPELMIDKRPKNTFYKVKLNSDFQKLIDLFNSNKAWDYNDEQFQLIFPEWCRPVSKRDLKRIYELFLEFTIKYNKCKDSKEIAAAICTLIHSDK